MLPSPHAVWERMREAEQSGELWDDSARQIYRIAVGFALATVMALPIGVLMGTFGVWEAALEPLVDFVRYMPVVGFVPLTILWVGFDDRQKFLIIWIGTFFQQVLLVMDNVKRMPPSLVDLGRTLGLSERAILDAHRRAARGCPAIWDSLRISLGWAWTWLVLAELSGASSGLGFRINEAQRFFETDTVIGYLLVLGLLGLVTDQGMKALVARASSAGRGRAVTASKLAHRGPRASSSRRAADRSSRSTAPTSRSPRTSSSRSSAPRAAARARCSRSSPG